MKIFRKAWYNFEKQIASAGTGNKVAKTKEEVWPAAIEEVPAILQTVFIKSISKITQNTSSDYFINL